MLFAEFVADLPKLHCWQGVWRRGGFTAAHLSQMRSFIGTHLPATRRIVETGAGNSTIAFLFCNPSRVVSIAPDADLFERIHSFCIKHSISMSTLEARAERSEWILPEMARAGDQFDFALIDGLHNWPSSMATSSTSTPWFREAASS